MEKHSIVGASSCYRWWECPGSVNLLNSIPDTREPSIYAEEGTAAHMLGEECIKKQENPLDHVGEIIETPEGSEILVTEEMAKAVKAYVDSIEYEITRFGTNRSFLRLEEKFELDIKGAFGTNDALLHIPFDTIKLWDYKHGKGVVVDVEGNKQLLYYALGALKGRGDVSGVEIIIVQPRAYHPDGPVRRANYTIKQLQCFESDLKEAISRTRQPNASLHAGDWCKFCDAKGQCPEIKKEVVKLAQMEFDEIGARPVSVKSLSLANRIDIHKKSSLIFDFLKEVSESLKHEALSGTEIPGHKLVKSKTNRKWCSETRVITALRDKYGDDLFAPQKLKTPAQMEKVVDKETVGKFTVYPEGKTLLVDDTDPRPAIDTNPANDFEEQI